MGRDQNSRHEGPVAEGAILAAGTSDYILIDEGPN